MPDHYEEGIAAPAPTGPAADVREKPHKTRGRKAKHPDDFDSEAEFLRHIRETFDKDVEADEENRKEAVEDTRFFAGQQWDNAVKARRDSASKPTLTINRLPAFVAQLVGNRRMNETAIKIIPDAGGQREIAQLREGLIRNIQKNSRAQYAYDKAFENVVVGGIGHFQVHLDYAHDDTFEQDIRIAAVPDPLSVIWDRASVDPTGSDANHVFVVDRLSPKAFKERYPDATGGDMDAGGRLSISSRGTWYQSDAVQVATYWRMRSAKREIAMMQDGSIVDVTDIPIEEWFEDAMQGEDGLPMVRDTQRRFAEMYLVSGNDILEGPYHLPIQRVPVFRVPGWEIFVEGDRLRWGLIRFLRDPQRLHNYWRSTIAEKLVGAPKAKWLASDTAVEGREDQWRKSHLSDDPLLVWNGDSGAPPIRTPPMEMEPALIEQAGVAAQDIKDVSNVHEANFGQRSNEVSGRAIIARQRVGELGTVIYTDNLNAAIEEAGKVVNQLIPIVYDTERIVKILGEDNMSAEMVAINGNFGPDITVGKYEVTVTTGPSYVTRRVEAREEMMAMVNSMPQTMAIAADKIVEAQDWPDAEKIAKRLRSQLPPNMVDDDERDPEELEMHQQQEQAAQEAQQQMQQLEMAMRQADLELKQAQAQEAQARADRERALAAKAMADIEKGQTETALDTIDRLNPPLPSTSGNSGNRNPQG